MPANYCLDTYNVSIQIGSTPDFESVRICLPYINVGMYIGNLTPTEWPPDYLREVQTGFVLLAPDGTPLQPAG